MKKIFESGWLKAVQFVLKHSAKNEVKCKESAVFKNFSEFLNFPEFVQKLFLTEKDLQ